MQFVKMHGAGNDYVYIDCFLQAAPHDPALLARHVSDRHRGIGADGLILIAPSEHADARMLMWNADGSRAEMCGNGIRCVAKYLYDSGICRRAQMRIETDRGVHDLEIECAAGCADRVRVNMGRPIFKSSDIPTLLPGDPPVNATLTLGGQISSLLGDRLSVTCVSLGNPHCAVFVDELNDATVLTVGPIVEQHAVFPKRVNVEFVKRISERELKLRVWERGSGETLACGTGACAAAVAGFLVGVNGRNVRVHLPGGELDVELAANGEVFLAGPAREVFRGEWPHAA